MDTIIGLQILRSRINERRPLIMTDMTVIDNASEEIKMLRSRVTYLQYQLDECQEVRNDKNT